MSISHHAGRQQLVCNGCDAAHSKTYERDEFDVMISDAKAAGWIVQKVAGEWQNTCPDCRERARPRSTPPVNGGRSPRLPRARPPEAPAEPAMTVSRRARITSEACHDRTTPPCPHCSGSMDASAITLEDLIEAWPLPERVEVEADGYAHSHQALVVTCGWCALPSAVAFDWRRVKLVAMRTKKDDAYLATHSVSRKD